MIRPIPGVEIEKQPETVVRRMMVYGEARGESPRGMLAVLHTNRNWAGRKALDEKQAILFPARFSAFNKNDPNRGLMLTAHMEDRPTWKVIDAVCELFEGGDTLDPSLGADHYYNGEQAQPVWGRGHKDWKETRVIGHHIFGVCP